MPSVAAVEHEREAAGARGLELALDRRLPSSILAGCATEVFCAGSCSLRDQPVAELAIVVDGVRHRPAAQRMPRRDRRVLRSGFWATVPIPPRGPGQVELIAEARLADGSTECATLEKIEVVERPEPLPYDGSERLIAICMATYNPDPELFRVQVESIRSQTYSNWMCLVSDDCSEPERFREIEEAIGDDARFVISRAERNQGFYRNFERALTLAPAEAELVALSDHDDRWYPDKLEALAEALESAQLAFSDLRRVDEAGEVRAETLWEGRRSSHGNLASLLVSNTIPGASCLFRREVIERALPFPDGPGWDFHDHWLALVAMSLGDVAYVDRPLYDYVQHPGAVLGRASANKPAQDPERPSPRARARSFMTRWRSMYFYLYLQRDFHARLLLLRCGDRLTSRKRRALRLVTGAARFPLAFAWLAARPARALVRRNDTLGVGGAPRPRDPVVAPGRSCGQDATMRACRPSTPRRSDRGSDAGWPAHDRHRVARDLAVRLSPEREHLGPADGRGTPGDQVHQRAHDRLPPQPVPLERARLPRRGPRRGHLPQRCAGWPRAAPTVSSRRSTPTCGCPG